MIYSQALDVIVCKSTMFVSKMHYCISHLICKDNSLNNGPTNVIMEAMELFKVHCDIKNQLILVVLD